MFQEQDMRRKLLTYFEHYTTLYKQSIPSSSNKPNKYTNIYIHVYMIFRAMLLQLVYKLHDIPKLKKLLLKQFSYCANELIDIKDDDIMIDLTFNYIQHLTELDEYTNNK